MKRLTAVLLLLILILPSFAASADGGISTYPERAIAYMDITFKCGCSRIGTGAMIATDGLITAGHNLICKPRSHKSKTKCPLTLCNKLQTCLHKQKRQLIQDFRGH